jgi:tRNA modification GTPase
MSPADTIVALSTAPGKSLRALLRISGNDAVAVVSSILHYPCPTSRGLHRVVVRLPGTTSTPSPLAFAALAIVLPAPRSFTAQTTIELLVPAHTSLIENIVAALTSQTNTRLAQPGEFTARAFLAGRLSLEQAEGIAAFIAAEHDEQLAAARDLKAGIPGKSYRLWADELTTLLALVEAGIDFTDQEDVVPIAPPKLRDRLRSLHTQIVDHMGGASGQTASSALPRVALVGLPNAGKSTLFNALLRQQRAIASPRAGTTRDIIEEELDLSRDVLGAGSITLQDLPGLSHATTTNTLDASVQSAADLAAQHAARAAVQSADVLIWCDPTGRFDTLALAGQLHLDTWHAAQPIIRVRTFGDHVRTEAASDANAQAILTVCAVDGWNLSSLRRAVADQACVGKAAGIAALLPRYRRSLSEAASAISYAITDVPANATRLDEPETIAESLRLALTHIGELVGNISPDDILGRVFATFCVGK